MSMVLLRSPLEAIQMNGANGKRRSARLSNEGTEENEPPTKRSKMNGASVATKQQDGGNATAKALARKPKRVYEEQDDGFPFSRSKKSRPKMPPVRTSEPSAAPEPAPKKPAAASKQVEPTPSDVQPNQDLPKPKVKTKRRLPVTPEKEAKAAPVRRSKRLSDEGVPGGFQPAKSSGRAHERSHHRTDSQSPVRQPGQLTVAKKRGNGEGVMKIALPFADTPIIRKNKAMRQASADNQHRRSSSGMRGRRASSLIDEGRGNALPHADVPTAEFYKHISAELTEPRRMRCLLGWCGNRALDTTATSVFAPGPPKPLPKGASAEEITALQTARVVQEELASELTAKGSLSDWFSRDDAAPAVPLVKKPNPRNVANAQKAVDLEQQLERLKQERAQWDALRQSAAQPPLDEGTASSPIHEDMLDTPERKILEQLRERLPQPEERLQHIARHLEFQVDQFAAGIHTIATLRDTAERTADKTLADSANVLEQREKERAAKGGSVDAMDALKALARNLNGAQR